MKFVSTSLALLCLLLAAGCATNPVTGDRDFAVVSEAEEIRQGQHLHPRIVENYGSYDDPALQAYVDRIGQQLARQSHRSQLDFTFTILDTPDINAFALPGGYVYITRGIMAYLDSEAELAGVLGHEIGHVTARHSVRQQGGQMATGFLGVLIAAATGSTAAVDISQQIGTGLLRGYGREHELEADRLGAEYLHRAGYDPDNMLAIISVLKDQEVYERELAAKENRQPNIYHGVFSTHPENDERLKTVVRAAKQLSSTSYRDDNRDGYRDMIDGMLWGPGARQGILAGSRYSHPGLGFTLEFPRGWEVRNTPEMLIASNPNNGAILQVALTALDGEETPAGLLRRLARNPDLVVETAAYGATARVQVNAGNKLRQPARLSAIAVGQEQALTLLGTSGESEFAATDSALLAVNRSFEHLTSTQVASLQAPRLKIIKREAETFASLAGASAIGYDAESILRLLNRAYPQGDIGSLERVKTVTVGD